MFTTGFYRDLGERTIATFAQALLAIFTVLAVEGGGLLEVDWTTAFSVAGLAALLAVLKAFAASAAGGETGASFGTAIPKAAVAAVETPDVEGQYEAEEASPFEEGTPVEVIPDLDHSVEYPAEIDAGFELDEDRPER